jgi:hypothetical protein
MPPATDNLQTVVATDVYSLMQASYRQFQYPSAAGSQRVHAGLREMWVETAADPLLDLRCLLQLSHHPAAVAAAVAAAAHIRLLSQPRPSCTAQHQGGNTY